MKLAYQTAFHLAIAVSLAAGTYAQDTSISYQGYLTDNGGVIAGPTNYSMSFRVYAAATGGSALPGGSLGPLSVTVEDSLFTVALPFTSSVWSGADRWLEVQVGAQVLSPRQKIRWAPYAVYALSSGSGGGIDGSGTANQVPKFTAADTLGDSIITEAGNNIGIGVTIPHTKLHVVGGTDVMSIGGGFLQLGASTGANVGFDSDEIMARNNGVVAPLHLQHNGGNLYIGGNAGGTPSNVGIGTATPAQKLSVVGTIQSTTGGFMFPDGTTQTTAAGFWIGSGANISNNNAGDVGIGTGVSTPLARLHVAREALSIPAGALENDDFIVEAEDATIGLYSSPGGNAASAIAFKEINAGALVDTWGIYRRTTGGGASLRFSYGLTDNYANNATMMQINANGDIGIGTTAPAAKLHVAGDARVQSEFIVQSSGGAVHAKTEFVAPGLSNASSGSNFSLFNGSVATATLSAGAPSLNGVFHAGASLSIDNQIGNNVAEVGALLAGPGTGGDGYFALKDGTGTSAVEIYADMLSDAPGIRMYRGDGSIQTVAIYASDSGSQGSAIDLRSGTGENRIILNAEEGAGRGAAVTLYNDAGVASIILDAAEGTGRGADIGLNNHVGVRTISIDADYDNTGVGRITTDVLEITGADLAEKFPASESIEPGMVVAIDALNEGKLCMARGAYNRTVAGVVSGANGFSVGAILGNRPESADGAPIALAGRVYVWVDADVAPIKPGDMLTTSDTPGHAMKVQDYSAAQGAIIGKAMGSLESGKGLVLVLVNLQ